MATTIEGFSALESGNEGKARFGEAAALDDGTEASDHQESCEPDRSPRSHSDMAWRRIFSTDGAV
jgi:hypothetical protein